MPRYEMVTDPETGKLVRRLKQKRDPGPVLEPLSLTGPFASNPLCVCPGPVGSPRPCGRVTNADMFVFHRGRYICDGCWTALRRHGKLTVRVVRRANYTKEPLWPEIMKGAG